MFDRGTEEPVALRRGVVQNQLLILEHFNDLPVIMAATPVMRQPPNQGTRYDCPVVVIERRGRLLFDPAVVQQRVPATERELQERDDRPEPLRPADRDLPDRLPVNP